MRYGALILAIAVGIYLPVVVGPVQTASAAANEVRDSANQTFEEAVDQDLTLIAKSHGWSKDDARTNRGTAEDVGKIGALVAEVEPDVFVGTVLSKNPTGRAQLLIKGAADSFVRALVAGSPAAIDLVDGQPYSFNELEERKIRVHQALTEMGFVDISTSVNIQGRGVIPAAVTPRADAPTTASAILAQLPDDLRDSVRLTLRDDPIGEDFTSFGGMDMLHNTTHTCTSGWTVVRDVDGLFGVSTAGHCTTSGLTAIKHGGTNHPITLVNFHRGAWGDFAFYSTSVGDADDFYSDTTAIRDVQFLEPRAAISVNESICFFGRTSLTRDCSLQVQDVSQACTNAGVFNDRLVMMDGTGVSEPGDSGGGFSNGLNAYGSLKGLCGPDYTNRLTFSVADLFDEGLGIRVWCGDPC